jgi:metal-responsive CopG/Arc/MetJ family transcriptional regulator
MRPCFARMRNRTDFVRNAVKRELQRREKMKTEKKARD